jgi:integrase
MVKKPNKKRRSKSAKKPDQLRGQMRPFTPQQIDDLATFLRHSDKTHAKRDYALMRMAVDTMLRSVDLLRLTHGHVLHSGEVRDEITIQQKKTGNLVTCALTAPAKEALGAYLADIDHDDDQLVFGITTRRYQMLVDDWCALLRLDKRLYSTHSFRRTKARQVYSETKNLAVCKKLLGHTSIAHTQEYLGVETEEALDAARRIVF